MIISEEEKEEIRNKYKDNTSPEVLNHLRRHYPVYEYKLDWMTEPFKQVYVDEKLYTLSRNKKELVNKISFLIEDLFPSVEKSIQRRTVKFYLDMIR